MRTLVVYEPWRPDPLAWIHRGEARGLAAELHGAGHEIALHCLRRDMRPAAAGARLLLRLSDGVLLAATRSLQAAGVAYLGPAAEVIARCYDKLGAARIAAAAGIDVPATATADDAAQVAPPRILRPRRGSDSIGLRVLGHRPVPRARRTADHLVQTQVTGTEITVAVLRGEVGAPLAIALPPGVPYTFVRKYVLRAPRHPLADTALAKRIRDLATRAATALGVDWAARIDLIHEPATDRLWFLECDVAPLVGPGSALAESLAAGGIDRRTQLRLLLGDAA